MTYTLMLASASPARLTTLQLAGIPAQVRVSTVNEEAVLSEALITSEFSLDPEDQVLVIARAKAEDVAATLIEELGKDETLPDFILGCDSMLEFGDEVLGKPGDAETATERWRQMRGKTGYLHTGHWLIDTRNVPRISADGRTSTAKVRFAKLTDAEIDAYVATGEPIKVAGAFTIDGLGGPYIQSLDGDHHGVVGLSLPLLRELLATHGVAIHELRQLG